MDNSVRVVLRSRTGAVQKVEHADTAFVELRNNEGEILQVLALRDDGSVATIEKNNTSSRTYERWFNVVFAELKKWTKPS